MLPRYLISLPFFKKIHKYCDCIIIGSGIAGLSTAMRLAQNNNIKVITKSSLADSTTWYAQGGIAAAIKKPDFWKKHYEDTIVAGQGLCDKKAVEILVKNAPKMIEDLIEIGTNFDISEGEISLTTEGGHSYPRILHAGGDATGEELEKKLVSYSKSQKYINFLPEYFVLDILISENRCIGISGMDINTGALEIHPSANIVIASGGIGRIYHVSTNPPISTGDGIAMAYRAGAAVSDIEFIQFHPTVFKTKESGLFLISEALRGEGAYLKDCHGNRFMVGKHPKAELAPRDIVVKEMVRVMDKRDCDYVYLDARHIPESHLKIRFPNIISKLKESGLDLKKDLIKVSPAQHYLNGGIKTDYNGKTNIKGLYCCGEAASTGAHGANRLASNSLIEGLVYGWKIYRDIEKKLKQKNKSTENNTTRLINNLLRKTTAKKSKIRKSVLKKQKVLKQISDFRDIMTRKVGILRDAGSLKKAKEFVDLHTGSDYIYNTTDKDLLEFANMLAVAGLIIKAAGIREESRGTHQRNDFPAKDDKNWKKHIILKQDKVYFKDVHS
jgi:L-aspartate oxidase